MNSSTLAAEQRSAGTANARAVRRAGKVPGTLYGHAAAPVSIAVEEKAFSDLLRTGAGHHLITLNVAGAGNDTALLRSVQRDPVTRTILHVDFQRVSSDESIKAAVPLTLLGVSPGVKDSGGVLDMLLHEIEISGPAQSLPEHLEFDISKLAINSIVHASEIKLPTGFALVTAADAVVLAIEPSRTATIVAEAEAEAAETATPEPSTEEATSD